MIYIYINDIDIMVYIKAAAIIRDEEIAEIETLDVEDNTTS